MGPYGSVWADIKTGKSPMAQDHFQTPPDPKMGYKNQKDIKNSLKVRAKPAKFSSYKARVASTENSNPANAACK